MESDAQTISVKWFRVGLEICILLALGLPILLLFVTVEPFHRGFYCDDESLRHPYKDSTVPSIYLYIVGFGLNLIAIVVLEIIRCRKDNGSKVVVWGRKVPNVLWQIYCSAAFLLLGMAFSQLSTDIIKYMVGRLRPHFYTVCQPVFGNGMTCEKIDKNFHRYVEDYRCTGGTERQLKEMRLSFPSGHSSFSMYTMLYFALYLQARWHSCSNTKILKHAVQFLAVLSSVAVAMSRISDYKHHWSDVLGGLTLGATVAIITARCFSGIFDKTGRHQQQLEGSKISAELTNLNLNNGNNV